MKLLVTGATGFLGKYVVEELSDQGNEVIAFGRNEKIGAALENPNVTFIKGDFVQIDDILNASKQVDAIVHAGALSTVWGRWEDFYQTNVLGTKNVLAACEKNQVKRLIFISSPSIYAAAKDQLMVTESDAPNQNNLNFYIKSKLLAEALIREQNQVDSVILRPRGLFGIGDTSIIPRLINVNKKIGIPLFDGGQQLVDVTCVENVALAVRLSLESPKAIGQTYNITNDEPTAFKAILDELHQELGVPVRYLSCNYRFMYFIASSLEQIYKRVRIKKEPMFTKYTLYLLKYSQTLSLEKAKKELNYQPKMTLTEGIRKYAKHYRSN